jgi:hypothetical protein
MTVPGHLDPGVLSGLGTPRPYIVCKSDSFDLTGTPGEWLTCVPHLGDSVFLPRGLCPACTSQEIPCCGQLHGHQLVPRVARRCLGVRQRSLPAGNRGHPGEARRAQIQVFSLQDRSPQGADTGTGTT